ncbi:hematopoietic SH2 domain-containing protein homolog isoform X3 [Siniperca chuatsi]|nr:hematopoietic SH2 domain-containing protein homolog isoform X3 [Siniperca chuatsi]XP_044056276.1 hematopoietic SH2 domain-containing protein homolog isoform X3 [Siniperca chuatsi]XP_044056277.1 hematopoietic SH2 domain-containing protein homolog isoform X3 [Siniperca chuatsi]XP_044056279.1 hematopoietic SH2 domain-containing protein homolog isoform X3 [Siniperca chuatsi]
MMEWSQSLQGQHDAFTWFTQSQLQSVIKNGIVPEWFHGIISRKTAEELLMSKPPGYFLIRVSESRIGYTLSYCAGNRCRHFMIDVLEDGHYTIVGENRRHRFLQDLVDFHRRNPIMPFTEVLTVACGQALNDKTDYAELLFPQRHPNPNTSLLPNNSLHASVSHPISQEDIPPALPHRPNDLRNSAILSPNRLYPSLEEEFPHLISPLKAMPVPMTRNRHTADNPPSNQPPEVPARRSVPPLKQNQACIRTVSAPDSPSTPTATEHPFGTNIQSVKNQEAKLSLVTNIKNLKKKFQKKRSTSQENMYAEINVEATDRSGNTENECQEMTGEQTFNGPPFSYTCTHVRLTDGELPQEYLPPPPFAPGY